MAKTKDKKARNAARAYAASPPPTPYARWHHPLGAPKRRAVMEGCPACRELTAAWRHGPEGASLPRPHVANTTVPCPLHAGVNKKKGFGSGVTRRRWKRLDGLPSRSAERWRRFGP